MYFCLNVFIVADIKIPIRRNLFWNEHFLVIIIYTHIHNYILMSTYIYTYIYHNHKGIFVPNKFMNILKIDPLQCIRLGHDE